MAKYHPVSPNVWDKRFRSLPSCAQRLYFYVLTNPHRRSEGLYRLPLDYVVADTGMNLEDVREGLEELNEIAWVFYDHEAEMLLDRRALEFFPPKGDRQITGAVNVVIDTPRSPLKVDLLRLAYIYAPVLADAIAEACPDLALEAGTIEKGEDIPPRYPIDRASIPRDRARARQLRDGVRDRGAESGLFEVPDEDKSAVTLLKAKYRRAFMEGDLPEQERAAKELHALGVVV